jgi:hypothetical protein
LKIFRERPRTPASTGREEGKWRVAAGWEGKEEGEEDRRVRVGGWEKAAPTYIVVDRRPWPLSFEILVKLLGHNLTDSRSSCLEKPANGTLKVGA